MNILAIETSCDETAVAVLNNNTLLSNIIYSQIKQHQSYGGIVPEIASRMHTEKINILIDKALEEAKLTLKDLDAIAVTHGPGLEGPLMIGISAAKTLGKVLNIPVVGVNHLAGHIYAHFLSQTPPTFPFMAMIGSGGHTQLVYCKEHFQFELLGETRDDAIGEAFDKVARLLGLGYPGGPIIEKKAKEGNKNAIQFPRAMKNNPYEFSFSGLKTAVKQEIEKHKNAIPVEDVCASFQEAAFDALISKALNACKAHHVTQLVLAGGVMANHTGVSNFIEAGKKENITVYPLERILCTDNAAMIGIFAYYQLTLTTEADKNFQVKPNLTL